MKEYELTILVHPDLEIDLEKPLTKIRKIVADNGGEIINEDNWGKRRLAYRIAGQDFAVYVWFELTLPAAAASKIDGVLNITDESLRHLLVSVDPKEKAAMLEQKAKGEPQEEAKE